MKIRSGTILVLIAIPVFLVVAGTSLWGRYLAQPGPLATPASVVINPGEAPPTIARKLAAAHVINQPLAFVAAVRLMHLTQTLKAGEYQFDPGISLRATVNKIAMGDTLNRAVTIPEGLTVAQAIRVISDTEGLTGTPLQAPEGMLFPDTYQFRFGTDRTKIMESMQTRMDKELEDAWEHRDTTLPYQSRDDLLIMASIIQKEAASNEEMPRIAAVFVNRLKQGMKLQSDPTVLYGAEATSDTTTGHLHKTDLTEPQPFNTYVYKGLPPTPIANPGKVALLAAAHPASETSIYFVADPSRTHHVFSSTYAEHQKNVQIYWETLKRLRGASTTLPESVSATLVTPTTLETAPPNPVRPGPPGVPIKH